MGISPPGGSSSSYSITLSTKRLFRVLSPSSRRLKTDNHLDLPTKLSSELLFWKCNFGNAKKKPSAERERAGARAHHRNRKWEAKDFWESLTTIKLINRAANSRNKLIYSRFELCNRSFIREEESLLRSRDAAKNGCVGDEEKEGSDSFVTTKNT